MNAEALKGHLESILLATLEQGPLHGYAVMETVRARSGEQIDLPSGTIYPALHRLELAGLVMSSWSAVGGRRRRTYQLTEAGRRQLRSERRTWQQFTSVVSGLLGGVPAEAPS
jgi:DNA-binding PadR family transcriptional regulator